MHEIPDRVCIIGAGSSGIAACKVLKEHGIPFDCYEAGEHVGGNWLYENVNGMSSAYKSLFANTSKLRLQYSDYPMPDHYPVFPHHTQIAEYFNNYVEHFGVKKHIRFLTTVTHASPLERGGWEVTLHEGSRFRYRGLLVANGHYWDPRWPEPPFPGHLTGKIIHSHSYKVPDDYVDKHVLVLGFGNSAMDIAVETSRVSAMTYLGVRRGFHVIPEYLIGKPLDQLPMPSLLPFALKIWLYRMVVRLQVGKMTDYGLPKPDYRVGEAHPTVSSDILMRITHGQVKVKPNIQQLDGDGVIFTDGTRERIDSIIYCTGYNITFPFFDPDVIEAKQNELPLFKRVFHPHYRDLFFLGLLQPLGAITPLVKLQSIWVSKYLLGQYTLPTLKEMLQDMQRERSMMRKRYGNSPRHTMQVDAESYIASVRKEMKRGMKHPSSPLIQYKRQAQGERYHFELPRGMEK